MGYRSASVSTGLVVAGVAGAMARRRFRRDLAAARARLEHPPAPLRYVRTSAGTVEFADVGDGVPVLVLHGKGGPTAAGQSRLTASVPSLIARASGIPWKRLSPAARAELREIARTLTPVRPRSDGMLFDNLVAYQEIADDTLPCGRVQASTLVVSSRDSPLPPPSDVAAVIARMPDARALELPTGGHLNLGNVDQLRATGRSFLDAGRG